MTHQEYNTPSDNVNPVRHLSTESHAFNVAIASQCGLPAAVIYNHILYWCRHNKKTGQAQVQGHTWTYQSYDYMADMMPYLGRDALQDGVSKLKEFGYIYVQQFGKPLSDGRFDKFDKTNWYTVTDESLLDTSNKSYERGKNPRSSAETQGKTHKSPEETPSQHGLADSGKIPCSRTGKSPDHSYSKDTVERSSPKEASSKKRSYQEKKPEEDSSFFVDELSSDVKPEVRKRSQWKDFKLWDGSRLSASLLKRMEKMDELQIKRLSDNADLYLEKGKAGKLDKCRNHESYLVGMYNRDDAGDKEQMAMNAEYARAIVEEKQISGVQILETVVKFSVLKGENSVRLDVPIDRFLEMFNHYLSKIDSRLGG